MDVSIDEMKREISFIRKSCAAMGQTCINMWLNHPEFVERVWKAYHDKNYVTQEEVLEIAESIIDRYYQYEKGECELPEGFGFRGARRGLKKLRKAIYGEGE